MHTHVLFSVHFSSYLTHKTGVNVNLNFSLSVQVDILLVRSTHLWDIKSNIWGEIPYLLATMSYFAYYKKHTNNKIFDYFPKISEDSPKVVSRPQDFRERSEDISIIYQQL